MNYEHSTPEGLYSIERVMLGGRGAWRALLKGDALVTRQGQEAVLKALLAIDLDSRPERNPLLDTSQARLPRYLSEWRQVRF